MSSDYRFAQPLVVRMMGLFVAGVGVVVLLLTAAGAVFSLPDLLLTVSLALVVVAIVAVGFVVTRGYFVVRLDDAGYQVRLIRGAGVRQARWRDVEDVVATVVAQERCVVLRLRDGRTTTIPVRALAGSAEAFVQDLRAHLDRGHGYRRIT